MTNDNMPKICNDYAQWIEAHNLPKMSMDDLWFEPEMNNALLRLELAQFLVRWFDMCAASGNSAAYGEADYWRQRVEELQCNAMARVDTMALVIAAHALDFIAIYLKHVQK